MTSRRQLKFEDWDSVVADLRSLMEGYDQHGKWTLEQVARHLDDWLRFPMDGFPKAPIPIRWMLAAMRMAVGKRMLSKIIAEGRMKDGAPTMPDTVHVATSNEAEAEAVRQLLDTVERFRSYQGPIHASPIFGPMDKQTAEQLQLVHFAHHLSWLSAKG